MEFNNLKAALLVVIAMSMITTNDAIIKHITEVFNVGQIMFLRGALICVIFACVMRLRGQPVFQRRSLHRWSLYRALFELCATLFLPRHTDGMIMCLSASIYSSLFQIQPTPKSAL